jgi:hypothetical protein
MVMTIKEKTMVLTKTYKTNGNDDDRRKQWQRQTKIIVMTTTDKNNGNDDDRRKQW